MDRVRAATATTTIVPTPPSRIQTPVAVWLTTGDRRVLLGRQDSISLDYNETHSGQPTIEVDESRSYQQMIGFGAAMTDASAYLIQNKLSAADREAGRALRSCLGQRLPVQERDVQALLVLGDQLYAPHPGEPIQRFGDPAPGIATDGPGPRRSDPAT